MLIIFKLIFNHTQFLQSTQFEEILILMNAFTVQFMNFSTGKMREETWMMFKNAFSTMSVISFD